MANKLEKLIACLVSPMQSLEDALQQLKTERSIDTAVGDQLDVVGKIAGQLRLGLDDDTYRRYIRARISAHNSDGTTEDLINICDLVIYDDNATYVVTQEGTATARVFAEGVVIDTDLAAVVFSFLEDAKSGGVRIVFEWGESPLDQLFQLDDGPGLDQGHLAGGLG